MSKRKKELLLSIDLIDRFKTYIRYEKMTLREIIDEIVRSGSFTELAFLDVCSGLLCKTKNVPKAWLQGIGQCKSSLHLIEADLVQLRSLSSILGASDVDGQLSGLALVEANLRHNLEEAAQQCGKMGKMYRSLGVLAGIAVAILIV